MGSLDGRTAFVFPGAGVALCGPEAEIFQAHRDVFGPLFDETSAFAGRDLAATLLAGDVGRLTDRENQLLFYAFSAGLCDVFTARGVTPDLVAGYSFGVYAAAYAAGAVSYADGMRILVRAYEIMDGARGERPAGLAVVVGLSGAEVDEVLAGGRWPSLATVNVNDETGRVVAGYADELDAFLAAATSRDAPVAKRLAVAIPYHHPRLLDGVTPAFAAFLAGVPVRAPRCPVVSSIDQTLITDAGALRDFLTQNLTTPIDWMAVARRLHDEGIERVVECGPGVSLTQSGRFLPFALRYVNVRNARRELAT